MNINLDRWDPNDRTGGFSHFSDTTGARKIDAVYTDTWKYDTKGLTALPREGAGHGGTVLGYTPPGWIGLNYVASDYAQKAPLVSYIATRIHEIGNSLFNQTGRRLFIGADGHAELAKRDFDPGMALEDCVFGGHVQPNGTLSTVR